MVIRELNAKRKAAEFFGVGEFNFEDPLAKRVKPLDKLWSAREKKIAESKRLKNTIDLLSPAHVAYSPAKKTPTSTPVDGSGKHESRSVGSTTKCALRRD